MKTLSATVPFGSAEGHLPLFYLLPSPLGEGLGVRLLLLPSGRSGGGPYFLASTASFLIYS